MKEWEGGGGGGVKLTPPKKQPSKSAALLRLNLKHQHLKKECDIQWLFQSQSCYLISGLPPE